MMNKLLIKLKQIKYNYEISQSFKQARQGKTVGPFSAKEAVEYLNSIDNNKK